MDLTDETGEVIYQFKAKGKKLHIDILWRGIPIKRFKMRVPLSEATNLCEWLMHQHA